MRESMRFKVHYGCGIEDVAVPDTCTVEVLEGKDCGDVDEDRIVREGIGNPLDAPPLEEFLDGGRLLIFTNDGDRPTPTWRILGNFIDKIKDRPDTKIVVGCGTHKPPTEEDYRFIFGDFYEVLKDKIGYHAAKDKDNLVHFGTTKRGNDIYMNKWVAWADKLLITGSVEPHYFAGFTGGRKWVIGWGGFETIERNHILALKDEACTLALDGNPIHEELEEWNRTIDKPKFCINIVQDKDLRIGACFAGDMDRVFEECVKVGHGMYSANTEGDADVVVTVSRAPQDSNLYQALKAQEHGKLAMKDGAILILVAECRRGLGPTHFGEMLRSAKPDELLRNIETQFHLGQHKIAKLLNTMMKGKVWVVTDLPAEDVAAVQMEKFSSTQAAVDKALEVMGPKAKIIVLPDGGMTVPRVIGKAKAPPRKPAAARPARKKAPAKRKVPKRKKKTKKAKKKPKTKKKPKKAKKRPAKKPKRKPKRKPKETKKKRTKRKAPKRKKTRKRGKKRRK